MSKLKTTLKEPDIDNRLLDDRGPTPERMLRVAFERGVERGDTGTITIVRQTPMDRAVARGTISEQHGKAAEKFYKLWFDAGCSKLRTNWKPELIPHGIQTANDFQDSNLARLNQAIEYIHEKMDHCGQSLDAIRLLFLVVCEEVPFEDAGLKVWPHRGAGKALALAIDRVRSALRCLTLKWGL